MTENRKLLNIFRFGGFGTVCKSAFNEKDFPYVVRQSQECVELCLKSALRFVGIEPPKWHDVGFIFEKEAGSGEVFPVHPGASIG